MVIDTYLCLYNMLYYEHVAYVVFVITHVAVHGVNVPCGQTTLKNHIAHFLEYCLRDMMVQVKHILRHLDCHHLDMLQILQF